VAKVIPGPMATFWLAGAARCSGPGPASCCPRRSVTQDLRNQANWAAREDWRWRRSSLTWRAHPVSPRRVRRPSIDAVGHEVRPPPSSPRVRCSNIGILGFCMGGGFAVLSAARYGLPPQRELRNGRMPIGWPPPAHRRQLWRKGPQPRRRRRRLKDLTEAKVPRREEYRTPTTPSSATTTRGTCRWSSKS
jgi:hypothetical protein